VDPGAVYEYAAPAMQYVQQPSVFNVSPETFAKLAHGGALTQQELEGMMGATAPAPVEAAAEAVAEAPAAVVSETAQAVSSATASKKEKLSKKKALSSKKKSKGCC